MMISDHRSRADTSPASHPAYPPSAHNTCIRGHTPSIFAFANTRRAPSRSRNPAEWTTATHTSPSVSTSRCRFTPVIFFPASNPRVPLVPAALTDWLSSAVLTNAEDRELGRLSAHPHVLSTDPFGHRESRRPRRAVVRRGSTSMASSERNHDGLIRTRSRSTPSAWHAGGRNLLQHRQAGDIKEISARWCVAGDGMGGGDQTAPLIVSILISNPSVLWPGFKDPQTCARVFPDEHECALKKSRKIPAFLLGYVWRITVKIMGKEDCCLVTAPVYEFIPNNKELADNFIKLLASSGTSALDSVWCSPPPSISSVEIFFQFLPAFFELFRKVCGHGRFQKLLHRF